jgi:hypothetical protein
MQLVLVVGDVIRGGGCGMGCIAVEASAGERRCEEELIKYLVSEGLGSIFSSHLERRGEVREQIE